MKNYTEFKVILWDFDGVIMNSMPVRDKGFEMVLETYPQDQVKLLLQFHRQNGGLSRYVKFRYFFEEIRNEAITNDKVQVLAEAFSKIMLNLLIDEKLLIADSVDFIRSNWMKYEMHIVSGSDGNELRKICNKLDLSNYFKSINGSPTIKSELIKQLIDKYAYDKSEVVLIGDSINDLEASKINNIKFIGYNNIAIKTLNDYYLENFNLK